MRTCFYSRWDATQNLLDPDEEALMDGLGQELISSGDVGDSLSLMQQEGLGDEYGKSVPGIKDLLAQLHQQKNHVDKQIQASADFINSDRHNVENEWSTEIENPELQTPDGLSETHQTRMLQKIDRLVDQFEHARNPRLKGIDERLLQDIMGDGAVDHLKRLKGIPQIIEKAGYITLTDGKYQLTPRGMRRIGQMALRDIFAQLRKNRTGGNHYVLNGSGGWVTDQTKKYASGDDFQLHLQKTIMNAVYRGPGKLPVRLELDDFEIFQRSGLERSATVLMIDLSFSMPARGHFEAAKQVAIALDGLIRSQYPKDSLYIVGFSNHARQIKKEDLSYINWGESDNYTNIQHGLYLARKLLAKERQTNKQIILVTDGEPTAHFENNTNFFCQVPPCDRTLDLTLQEVRNCTREGIVINTFMFENDQFLADFVTKVASINKGRVFFTSSDTLGQYLIVDYMAQKKRMVTSRG